ncbi:MAG: matrixin family metalloprotease [Bacteriovoracaceae bacterium]|nr:matrixin family metalloprotease [Bacteriovoracaceae bacterium]
MFQGRNNQATKTRTWMFWSISAIILAAQITTTTSFAYQFTSDFRAGFFWMNFPIYFTVNPSEIDETDLKMTEDALVDAIEIWFSQSSSPIKIWEFIPWDQAQGRGNIQTIKWSSNFTKDTGYSALGTMAVTMRQSSTPFIRKADIVINTSHTSLKNQENLTLVLIHELGHTIGLDHSSQAGAIMYSSLSFGPMANRDLTPDDIDGYNAVVAENLNRQRNGSSLTQKKSGLGFLPGCSKSSAVTNGQDEELSIKYLMTNITISLISIILMILVIIGAGKIFTLFDYLLDKLSVFFRKDEKNKR